jgi:hypothetical protein
MGWYYYLGYAIIIKILVIDSGWGGENPVFLLIKS